MATDTHSAAWRIPTEDGSDYGVLVRCGPENRPYWWLLCPGTATLYIDPRPQDFADCQHGLECNYLDDVHAGAGELFRALTDRICGLCGAEYPTEEEAASCEELHHMAEQEMGVFDG